MATVTNNNNNTATTAYNEASLFYVDSICILDEFRRSCSEVG